MNRLFARLLGAVLTYTVLITSFASCVHEDKYDNTNRGNLEALWTLMDEHYCFFDYKKQEVGVDWNEVRARYINKINDKMDSQQLFEVMAEMLAELRDGHVNLGAAFDYARNWSWREDYPAHYNDSIVETAYLGKNYKIASGLKYRILEDNIGYVRVESFSNAIGSGNVSLALNDMALCHGLIIDIRNNGGGNVDGAETLASHFTNERLLTGYVSHKTGKGHADFSKPKALYLEPAAKGVRWQKPVVVLTNRGVFSAANDFVRQIRLCPNVTIMGDRTGGGSGMPFSSELPNGWSVRYSAVIYYDQDMRHTEFGIEPDVVVGMSGADTSRQRDTLIEAARRRLSDSLR